MKFLRDLPNQHGFTFTGIKSDGGEIQCIIKLCVKSNKYRIYDLDGNPCYSLIESWKDLT